MKNRLTTFCRSRQAIASMAGLAVVLVLVGVLVPQLAHAGVVTETVADLFIALLAFLVSAIGKMVVTVISILAWVASYNEFINAPTVIYGWVLVRDVANMAFVIILLIIAIATILPGMDNYNYKKLLPKVLLLALLVNFSRTIYGLIIDAGQVVMLTFVAGFKDIGPGNLMAGVGLADVLRFSPGAVDKQQITDVRGDLIAIYLYAILYLLVLLVVMLIMVVQLAFRIVMLWLFVVLSPLVFLLMAIPSGAGKANQMFGEFTKYVIAGPTLAFFIWLSMASFSGAAGFNQPGLTGDSSGNFGSESGTVSAGIGKAGEPGFLTNFIISVGLLVGGLTMTAQLKVAGAGLGTAAIGKAKSWGTSAAKWTAKRPLAVASYANRKQAKRTGIDLSPVRQFQAIRAGMEQRKKTDWLEAGAKTKQLSNKYGGRSRRGQFISMMGNPEDFWKGGLAAGIGKVNRMTHIGDINKGLDTAKGERYEAGLQRDLAVAATAGKALSETDRQQIALRTGVVDSSVINQVVGKTGDDAETVRQKLIADATAYDSAYADVEGYTPSKILAMHAAKMGDDEKVIQKQLDYSESQMQDGRFSDVRKAGDGTLAWRDRVKRNADLGRIEREMSDIEASYDRDSSRYKNDTRYQELQRDKGAIEEYNELEKQRLAARARLEESPADAEGHRRWASTLEERANNTTAKTEKQRAQLTPDLTRATQQQAELEAEEQKGFDFAELDETELAAEFKKAVAQGLTGQAMAIIKRAGKDGNLQWMLNLNGYEGSATGIEDFRRDVLEGRLGMGAQDSMKLLKEASANTMKAGDTNFVARYLYDSNRGEYYAADIKTNAMVAASRVMKKDTEKMWREMKTGEMMALQTDGSVKLNLAGQVVLEKRGGDLEKQIKLNRVPTQLLQDLMSDKDVMVKSLQRGGMSETEINDLLKAIEGKIGKSVKNAKDDLKDSIGKIRDEEQA